MTTSTDQKRIIGENIKSARKIKGFSQRALAEKLGIAFQNLSVWENGKGAPSAKYLLKLAEILEISLDQLTSPSGFAGTQERIIQRPSFGGFHSGFGTDQLLSELQKIMAKELPAFIHRELAESHSLKLIIAYLEEIQTLLRTSSPERLQVRRVAEPQTFQSYAPSSTRIPLPPVLLSPEERNKWERNTATLSKWLQSPQAFWIPNWVMEKYCRETEPSHFGDNLEEAGKVIKNYLEQGQK